MPIANLTKPYSKLETTVGINPSDYYYDSGSINIATIPLSSDMVTISDNTNNGLVGWVTPYTPLLKEDIEKLVKEILEQRELAALAKQTKVKPSGPFIRPTTAPLATTPPQSQQQQKNTATTETHEAAYRIAVKQLLQLARQFLCEQFEKGNKTAASQFLASEWGTAVTASFILTLVADKFPQKHLDILSKELRVSTLALVGNDTVDLLKETLSKLNLPQETCKTVPVVLEQTHEEELVYETRRVSNQQR